eukprot:444601-Pyramimonas_sp.AAC.1
MFAPSGSAALWHRRGHYRVRTLAGDGHPRSRDVWPWHRVRDVSLACRVTVLSPVTIVPNAGCECAASALPFKTPRSIQTDSNDRFGAGTAPLSTLPKLRLLVCEAL